jgi:hypothetical protein
LPGGRLLRRRPGRRDDLLRRSEPLQDVADGGFAGGVFLAQGGVDVLADLRHELDAPRALQLRRGVVETLQVVVDETVSLHRDHRLSFL